MKEYVCIEDKQSEYVVKLIYGDMSLIMDHRQSLDEAKDYAFYLSQITKLNVIYEGREVKPSGYRL
jgi:hypothetical protein